MMVESGVEEDRVPDGKLNVSTGPHCDVIVPSGVTSPKTGFAVNIVAPSSTAILGISA
jgi:hypothetical protein